MGVSAIARCSCGYVTPPLMIGGGMASYRHLCAFPAFCSGGDHLVMVNMFERPLRCPDGHRSEPVPYDSPPLVAERGTTVVASWRLGPDRALELTDGRYLCPACHRESLSFADGGILWD